MKLTRLQCGLQLGLRFVLIEVVMKVKVSVRIMEEGWGPPVALPTIRAIVKVGHH